MKIQSGSAPSLQNMYFISNKSQKTEKKKRPMFKYNPVWTENLPSGSQEHKVQQPCVYAFSRNTSAYIHIECYPGPNLSRCLILALDLRSEGRLKLQGWPNVISAANSSLLPKGIVLITMDHCIYYFSPSPQNSSHLLEKQSSLNPLKWCRDHSKIKIQVLWM